MKEFADQVVANVAETFRHRSGEGGAAMLGSMLFASTPTESPQPPTPRGDSQGVALPPLTAGRTESSTPVLSQPVSPEELLKTITRGRGNSAYTDFFRTLNIFRSEELAHLRRVHKFMQQEENKVSIEQSRITEGSSASVFTDGTNRRRKRGGKRNRRKHRGQGTGLTEQQLLDLVKKRAFSPRKKELSSLTGGTNKVAFGSSLPPELVGIDPAQLDTRVIRSGVLRSLLDKLPDELHRLSLIQGLRHYEAQAEKDQLDERSVLPPVPPKRLAEVRDTPSPKLRQTRDASYETEDEEEFAQYGYHGEDDEEYGDEEDTSEEGSDEEGEIADGFFGETMDKVLPGNWTSIQLEGVDVPESFGGSDGQRSEGISHPSYPSNSSPTPALVKGNARPAAEEGHGGGNAGSLSFRPHFHEVPSLPDLAEMSGSSVDGTMGKSFASSSARGVVIRLNAVSKRIARLASRVPKRFHARLLEPIWQKRGSKYVESSGLFSGPQFPTKEPNNREEVIALTKVLDLLLHEWKNSVGPKSFGYTSQSEIRKMLREYEQRTANKNAKPKKSGRPSKNKAKQKDANEQVLILPLSGDEGEQVIVGRASKLALEEIALEDGYDSSTAVVSLEESTAKLDNAGRKKGETKKKSPVSQSRFHSPSLDTLDFNKEIKHEMAIWDMCLSEIIRQENVECGTRAALLERIRQRFVIFVRQVEFVFHASKSQSKMDRQIRDDSLKARQKAEDDLQEMRGRFHEEMDKVKQYLSEREKHESIVSQLQKEKAHISAERDAALAEIRELKRARENHKEIQTNAVYILDPPPSPEPIPENEHRSNESMVREIVLDLIGESVDFVRRADAYFDPIREKVSYMETCFENALSLNLIEAEEDIKREGIIDSPARVSKGAFRGAPTVVKAKRLPRGVAAALNREALALSGKNVESALASLERRVQRVSTVIRGRLLQDRRDLGVQTELSGDVEKKEERVVVHRRRASIDAAVGDSVLRFEQSVQTELKSPFEVREPFIGIDYGVQTEDIRKKKRSGDDRDTAVEELLDLLEIGSEGPIRTAIKFLGQLYELGLRQGLKGIYSWPRFILNFFTKMFGLQSIAEKHCANFLKTIIEESKISKDHRLKTFIRLASLSEESAPISVSAANVYLAVLEELHKRYRILAGWDKETDKRFIDVDIAFDIIATLFGNFNQDLCRTMTMEIMRSGKQISTDRLLELCLEVYEGSENDVGPYRGPPRAVIDDDLRSKGAKGSRTAGEKSTSKPSNGRSSPVRPAEVTKAKSMIAGVRALRRMSVGAFSHNL